MKIDECYQLGFIVKPHGLKGEVESIFDVDFPEEYDELESVFVRMGTKLVPFFISSIKIKGNKVVLNFEDINDLENAEELRGLELFLPLSFLPELTGNQFYFHEVIGYRVVDVTSGEIGLVKAFFDNSSQDLMEVVKGSRTILVPLNDDILTRVDRQNQTLHVDVPDGLLDI